MTDKELIEQLHRYADCAKRGAPAPEWLLRDAAHRLAELMRDDDH